MRTTQIKFGMPILVELPTIEEHFILAAELGLDFIELNMTFPQYQLENLHADNLRALIEKYGIYLTIHLDENINIGDFNQEISRVYIESVLKTIHLAKKLDITILNMHLAESIKVTLPDRHLLLFDEYIEDYLNRFSTFRAACVEAISDSEIKICIENLNGFKKFHKKGIDLLLESPIFGLTLDIGHDFVTNHIDERFIFDRLDRLRHFHIHDSTEKNCHLTLGTGRMDIEQKLKLAQIHGGSCVLEIKTLQALTESVNWLKVKKWL